MTDQSKAPDVMYVFPKKDWFNAGASTHKIKNRSGAKDVSYTRTDLIEARVAAEVEGALRKAADEIEAAYNIALDDNTIDIEDIGPFVAARGQILALIPQPSALDEMLAEAERKGMERAATQMDTAAHIMSHHGSHTEVQTYQNAAKAIRRAALEAE